MAADLSGDLIDALAHRFVELVNQSRPAPLRPCMTYGEAADMLRISHDSVRGLVDRGVLDRPEWSRTGCRTAIVTTASVYREAGWPIVQIEAIASTSDERQPLQAVS